MKHTLRKFLSVFAALAATAFVASSQIVTTTPSPLQQSSSDVVLTYHADMGNRQLMGLTASTPIYAHIGVVTNLSNGSWAYAPSWGDNSAKYKLAYVSPNTWRLDIGDINTYFGIKDPAVVVEKIAVVFRTADGSLEGKTATGGDIFVDVLPAGFAMQMTSDAPFVLTPSQPAVKFNVGTTMPASIAMYIDSTDSQPFASSADNNATSLSVSRTFAPSTDCNVIAKAVDAEGKVLTDTITICYPQTSSVTTSSVAPQQGATENPDGTVTFCIAAPYKTTAMIIGSWNGFRPSCDQVMQRVDTSNGISYFTVTVGPLDKGVDYPYYYLIDNTLRVGDPYARLVLDPYNDKYIDDGTYPGMPKYPHQQIGNYNVMLAVYNSDRDVYDWQVDDFKAPDPDNAIIYEMLLRDFTGTEGQARGNGTLAQAMEKLPYLKELGVNAIELMPIQEFNGNNSWGYNTNFYFAPDKAYGSPDAYRKYIDTCHQMGMAVILDVVFNQSDGLHPWYQMYTPGSNPFYNERAPHAYSVLNDWNQDNMLVRQQWLDMVRYWMTAYRVDGFRFDLVKGLGTNESYGGNASEANTNKYNASRIEHMKQLTELIHSINPRALSINENLAGSQEENAMAQNGQLNWANINHNAAQFAMGYQSGSNCNRFYAPYDDNRLKGSTVSYAESHDEQRIAYLQRQNGVSQVKGSTSMQMRRLGSLAAQMILAPGSHMIWQFEELGNATSTKNSDGSNNTDPKPVLWSYLDQPARRGLYDTYAKLIDVRLYNPEFFSSTAKFTMNCGENSWSGGRTMYFTDENGRELICVINPNVSGTTTFRSIAFTSNKNDEYSIVAASYGTNPKFDAVSRTVTLDPGAFVLLGRGEISAVDDPMAPSLGDTNQPVTVYNIQGMKVTTLAPGESFAPTHSGIYIFTTPDGNASKVMIN